MDVGGGTKRNSHSEGQSSYLQEFRCYSELGADHDADVFDNKVRVMNDPMNPDTWVDDYEGEWPEGE